jgi:hypothetical protein
MTELNLSGVYMIAHQDIPQELASWRAGINLETGALSVHFSSPDKSTMISVYGDGVIRTSYYDGREPVYVGSLEEAVEAAGAAPARHTNRSRRSLPA